MGETDTPPAARFPWPSAYRLRRSEDVRRVVQQRNQASVWPIVAFAATPASRSPGRDFAGRPYRTEHLRLCVSLRRTVGTAPQRNRIKRVIRDIVRRHQHELPPMDFVISIKAIPPQDSAALNTIVPKLMRKAARRASGPTKANPPTTAASSVERS